MYGEKNVSSFWRSVWISRPSILRSTYASPKIWWNCMVPIISLKSPGWAKKSVLQSTWRCQHSVRAVSAPQNTLDKNVWYCSKSPQSENAHQSFDPPMQALRFDEIVWFLWFHSILQAGQKKCFAINLTMPAHRLAWLPQLARPSRPEPCLDFGFQYALIRNNWSNKIGVEYWALPG